MPEVDTIVQGLGPAERMALATRQATQQTADRLADKRLSRHVQGPPRRAYARATKIALDLTDLGQAVAQRLAEQRTPPGE